MSVDPVDFHESITRIPSHASVAEIREFVVGAVDGARVHEASGCVVARRGPADGGPHAFLNSHLDTVPPYVPFERDGDVVRGRGACDAKGSLAALVAAFTRVEPGDGRVTLVLSPDEETRSEGLYDFLSLAGDAGDMAVVGEPTGLDVCDAARGSLKYVIELAGTAAHAGTPEGGADAVSAAAAAIRRIESMEGHEHDYLGETSETVSWIEGGPVGELTSQVPESVRLFLNRWSVPPETPESYRRDLEAELSGLDCEVTVRYPYMPNRFLDAHREDPDEPVIRDLVAAADRVKRGGDGDGNATTEVRPFSVAAESSFLSRYMPVAVFGPGLIADDEGPIGHSRREYVRTSEIRTAADVLTAFLRDAV